MLITSEYDIPNRLDDLLSAENVFNCIVFNWEEKIIDDLSCTVQGAYLHCSFTGMTFYWNLFCCAYFIDCSFQNVKFRGSSFRDCRFLKCKFINCEFTTANVGNGCIYDGTIWCETEFIDCINPPINEVL